MMTGKTILHLYSSWTAGGAEKLLVSLAEGLERRGFRNVVAAPGDSYLFSQAKERGLRACPLVIKGSFDPLGIAGLGRIVARERIDIIHAHQGKVFWPAIIMKRLKGPSLKVVFHRHAQLPHRFYSRGHYRAADRTIAISRAVAEGLVEGEKVPREKVRVVYNGTDFTRFSSAVTGDEVRRQYGLGGDPVIGTAAAMNLPKGKGQGYLIEAVKMLSAEFPKLRCLIVGTGPLERKLKKQAEALGIGDRVVFAGYREDVERYIAAMDVFCFLSWDTEGFGQVMVEAQALGKPVVGTSIGGIPETFEDGRTGILIRPGEAAAAAEAVRPLLGDRARREQMGQAASRFVRERFSIEGMVENVIAVYREISPAKNAPGSSRGVDAF